jgi:hypothetical protein
MLYQSHGLFHVKWDEKYDHVRLIDSSDSEQYPMTDSREHYNATSGSIHGGKFIFQLNDPYPLKDYTPRIYNSYFLYGWRRSQKRQSTSWPKIEPGTSLKRMLSTGLQVQYHCHFVHHKSLGLNSVPVKRRQYSTECAHYLTPEQVFCRLNCFYLNSERPCK